MNTCPHGIDVVNPRDWLGWNFCEHCPDCIAQLADHNAELQGDLRMVRSTAKAALEFIDTHAHQKKRQSP